MGLSFDRRDRRQERRQRQRDRWNNRLDGVSSRFNELRLRLKRSPNGLALGVFRGVADSLGWCVCWTRIIGCIALLALSGDKGHASLLVAGFFYLLAAVLMGKPDVSGSRIDTHHASGSFEPDNGHEPMGQPSSRPYSAQASRRPIAVPFQQVPRPRVDFAALDRQLDVLNRRIQRMEGIVTDRHYDWDRRMES
jgi:hypothetical protein